MSTRVWQNHLKRLWRRWCIISSHRRTVWFLFMVKVSSVKSIWVGLNFSVLLSSSPITDSTERARRVSPAERKQKMHLYGQPLDANTGAMGKVLVNEP